MLSGEILDCELHKKQEDLIKSLIEFNSGNTNKKLYIRETFSHSDEFDASHFDVNTTALWENIKKVALILIKDSPLTFDQLVEKSCITNSEARRCIRILIDIGGEIEVIKRYRSNKLVFILHN